MSKLIRILLFVIAIFVLFSCKISTSENKKEGDNKSIYVPVLEYEFIDSTEIGVKGNYKIEACRFTSPDSTYVQIILSKKNSRCWDIIQRIKEKVNEVLITDIDIQDFNNDGYNDFTYRSTIAANGANDLRKLYIFDKEKNRWVYVKNSEEYPNLSYNQELDCIIAYAVYGGSSTTFLKLENDLLRAFANIKLWDNEQIVTIVDTMGNEIIIDEAKVNVDSENFDLVYGCYDYRKLKEYSKK